MERCAIQVARSSTTTVAAIHATPACVADGRSATSAAAEISAQFEKKSERAQAEVRGAAAATAGAAREQAAPPTRTGP